VQSLVKGAVETLKKNGVKEIGVTTVPGSFELPFGTKSILNQSKVRLLLLNSEMGCMYFHWRFDQGKHHAL
jgi:hypothetical protein